MNLPLPESGNALLVRMLTKTALKAVIWSVMAAIITYVWPDASWVWYVVLAFVIIGIGFGIVSQWLVNRRARP